MKIKSHRRAEFEWAMKLAFLSSFFAAAACFAQSGALDLSFNPGSGAYPISALWLVPNGQILVGGEFASFNGVPSQCVARLNAYGAFDATFDYVGTGPNSSVYAVATQTNGMVMIAGAFTTVDGISQPYLARLRTDGSLDLTYTNKLDYNVNSLLSLVNGGLLAVGPFTSVNGTTMNNMARFNPDGSLDTTFHPPAANNGLSEYNPFYAVAIETNGFVVIGGQFSSVGGHPYQSLARLTSTGAVDTSFVGPGLPAGYEINAILILTNGQMVVAGDFTSINGYSELGLARLNSDGTLDITFSTGPVNYQVVSLALQSNGKILVNGENGLKRLNADGSLDTSFSVTISGGSATVDALVLQPDGKILVSGAFTQVNGTNITGVARLHGDAASQSGVQLLNMNLYPGMFLSGSIGTNYLVEYTTNLNAPSLWTPLMSLTLTNSPTFIADPTLPGGSRFYRAVTIP